MSYSALNISSTIASTATSALVGIKDVSLSTLSSIWNRGVSYFKENIARKALLDRIENRLADPREFTLAKLYFRELKEKITATSKTQDPTAMCKNFETTSGAYKRLVDRVESVVYRPGGEEDFERVYNETKEELNRLKSLALTETERSIYIGKIMQAFRFLDNKIAEVHGNPLHHFCGCHISEEGDRKEAMKFSVPYPKEFSPNLNLNGRSALLQSWSLGGGHNVAQRGMAQRLAEAGMHSYHIEADNETLRPFDALRGLTGDRVSDTDLVRFLMRNNCWKTLRFINWAFSGKPSEKTYQAIQDQFMRSILARGAPELQMTIYARNTGAAANAAGRVGVADIHVETDLMSAFFDVQKPDDIQNPYFADAAMVDGEKELGKTKTSLGNDRVFITGFPVREAFLKQYDTHALRKERGIANDARVVVLSSGGEGVENGYAQYIVKQYEANPALSKIHLVVLCGKNEAKKRKLEQEFAALNNPRISVQVRGWTDEDELAKLNAMAADPNARGALISTKGGGGTLSEGLASGVPMLLGSSDDIEWEKINIDYVCEQGCGLRFKGEPDLMERLDALFQMPYQRINIDSKERSMALVEREVKAAESDVAFQNLRGNALAYQPPRMEEI